MAYEEYVCTLAIKLESMHPINSNIELAIFGSVYPNGMFMHNRMKQLRVEMLSQPSLKR